MFSEIDSLISRVLTGDDAAWTALVGQVHPAVLRLCRSLENRAGLSFLAEGELEREVAVRVLHRLKQFEHRALVAYMDIRRRYKDAAPNAEDSFARWLSVVVRRIRVDYLRSLPEYLRIRAKAGRQTLQVEHSEFCDNDVSSTSLLAMCIRRVSLCLRFANAVR